MDRNQAATEIFNALIALCNREPAPRVQMRAQGESLVLHLLARHPDGMVAEEIRQIMDVSSARVAAILANLERNDLIIRLIEPEDRRRLRIMQTPAGQTHAETEDAYIIDRLEQSLAVLDQGGDLGHIVRHGEVQPDLPHDEQKAEQDHGHLFPLKSFEKLIHIASLPYL